jgi:hypothetical protein
METVNRTLPRRRPTTSLSTTRISTRSHRPAGRTSGRGRTRETTPGDSIRPLLFVAAAEAFLNRAALRRAVNEGRRGVVVWWCPRLIRPPAAARRVSGDAVMAAGVWKGCVQAWTGRGIKKRRPRDWTNDSAGNVQSKTSRELNAFPCDPFWMSSKISAFWLASRPSHARIEGRSLAHDAGPKAVTSL